MTHPDPNAMPENLLPCPFCGGKAMHLHTMVKSLSDATVMLDYDVIHCSKCRASSVSHCDDADAAFKAWNKRAALAPTSQWLDIKDASHNEHWILACNDELTHSFVAAWSNRHQCFLDWNGDAIDVLHWQPLHIPKAPPTKDLAAAEGEKV